MKSFCISLEKKKSEWPELLQYFHSKNVNDVSIFPAVIGKEVEYYYQNKLTDVSDRTKSIIKQFGDGDMISNWALYHLLNKTERRDHMQLGTFGAIGCYLSHAVLWQQMINENIPFLLIFEDDVLLNNNFNQILNLAMENLPQDADFLFLGLNENFEPQPFNNLFSLIGGQFMGTHGYIATLQGVKKIMPKLFPIEVQIDACMSILNSLQFLKLYTLKNYICKQKLHISSIQTICTICNVKDKDIQNFNLRLFLLSVFVIIILLLFFIYNIVKKTHA